MTNLELLERLGAVEPLDASLLERTAEMLASLDTPTVRVAPVTPSDHRREARRRRRRAVTLLAVAAAVVALALTVTVTGILPGSSTRPPAAGATELGKLALAASAQPSPTTPGPGQYQYTKSIEAYTSSVLDGPHPYTDVLPDTRQIWIGADGSGRILETFGTASFLSAADRAAWVAAGSPDLAQAPWDTTYGPGQLSDGPTDLTKLPTDPTALAALISSRKIEGGPPGPAEDFTQVGDLLRETDAPPALRAALFTVAESIPGVEQLGAVTDHLGGRGVGVAFLSGGVRHELIFDSADGRLLAEQDVVVDAAAAHEPAGTVADWAVYVASGVVDSVTAQPGSSSAAES